MKTFIIETYEELYSKLYRIEFDFIPTERQDKMIDNFLIAVKKRNTVVGEDFLWNLMVFQFERFSGFRLKSSKKIQFSWIIGKKALKNWDSREKNWDYWNKEFCNKYGIRRKIAITYKLSKEYLEGERMRLYGSDSGFLYCKELELYNELSPSCVVCKFRKYCE